MSWNRCLPPGVADSFASGTPLDGDRTSRDYAIRIANGSTLKLVREIDATKIAPSGMRLPAANVEILRPDINDFLFQEGCMRFDRTANKYQLVTEPVVGVDASRRQKSFKEITPGGACEETMAISLRNRTAETQSVRVREYLARSPKYRILECAPDYVELAPNLLQFELQIPPNQTSNVTYTVRYEF